MTTPTRKPAKRATRISPAIVPHPKRPTEPYEFLAVWSPSWGFLTPETSGVGKPEMFDNDERTDAEAAAKASNSMHDGYLTDWRVVRVALTRVGGKRRGKK